MRQRLALAPYRWRMTERVTRDPERPEPDEGQRNTWSNIVDSQRYNDGGIDALFDLSFQRFITLSVIKVLYLLGLALIALMWLIVVIGGFGQGFMAGLVALVVGSLAALLYVIFYRVWLELIVVLFRIGENTSKLVEAAGRPPAGDVGPGR
jgi:hypothetical protein